MIKSRRMRWAGHIACIGGRGSGMHTGLWSEIRRKEITRKTPRRRWEDNINMDFKEIGWGGMDWIDLFLG
jgi:hypothetical protein